MVFIAAPCGADLSVIDNSEWHQMDGFGRVYWFDEYQPFPKTSLCK